MSLDLDLEVGCQVHEPQLVVTDPHGDVLFTSRVYLVYGIQDMTTGESRCFARSQHVVVLPRAASYAAQIQPVGGRVGPVTYAWLRAHNWEWDTR